MLDGHIQADRLLIGQRDLELQAPEIAQVQCTVMHRAKAGAVVAPRSVRMKPAGLPGHGQYRASVADRQARPLQEIGAADQLRWCGGGKGEGEH